MNQPCFIVALAVALAASACRPRTPPAEATTVARWWDVLEPYPGARTLCNQHVDAQSAHVDWALYAVRDAPDRVMAFYNSKGHAPFEADRSGGWTMHANESVSLGVFDASAQHPRCGTEPIAGEATVLIAARLIRAN